MDIYKQLLLFFKKQNYLHLNNFNNKNSINWNKILIS